MPVKKVGDKWEVNGQEYDTEEAANNAYKAMLALKFDIEEDPKKKKKTKKKSKEKKEEEEEDEE